MKSINKGNKYNGSNEYQKAIDFLEKGCDCGCFSRIPKEQFAELRESFQALTKSEQDIFLMAQIKAMDGGLTSSSRRFKKKTRSNKRTFYHWDHNTLLCQETYLNMLGIGRTYFGLFFCDIYPTFSIIQHQISRKLVVNQNYSKGKTQYCSIDATAHYSYD